MHVSVITEVTTKQRKTIKTEKLQLPINCRDVSELYGADAREMTDSIVREPQRKHCSDL